MKNPPHHHLLLGLLALQNGFISKEQLVASFSLWTLNKQQSLDSILVDQKAISEPVRGLLIALVEQHLLQHGNDPERSLAALRSVPPIKADLDRIGDSDIQASIAGLPPDRRDDVNQLPMRGRPDKELPKEAGEKHPPDQWPTVQRSGDATPNNRFIVLRPHAEGGLGKVSVALDRELNRNVAFKEILTPHADDAVSQERFIREAEITGQLEHPGIVPVYGLGSYGDGRPYYAMRFVEGENLKTAIASFHKDLKLKSPIDGHKAISFRNQLGRFVDVCQAIEYAHSRHVLHRDLKPDNILLGPYGETLVVDWGLAKPVGSQEVTNSDSKGRSVQLRSGSGSQTVDGSVVGTPNYMSPEQAQGKIDELGAATDVYSLGATLYALLTGKAPFSGGNLHETLEKVRRGELELPRKHWPSVPRALEAICMKAMSVVYRDRYQSARALGEDIEKWLADESVTAYAEPFSVRAKRWIKRHPALVAGATACALLGLATSGIIAYLAGEHARELQIKNETIGLQINEISMQKDDLAKRNDELFIARNEAENSRKLAVTEKEQAQSVTDFLVKSFRKTSPDQEGKLLTVYESLIRAEKEIDEQENLGPLNKAALFNAMCNSFLGLGLPKEAVSTANRAVELRRRELGEEHPDTLNSQNNLAASYCSDGKCEQAISLFESTLKLQKVRPGENAPESLITQNNLAAAYFASGKLDLAISLHEATLKSQRVIIGSEHPDTLVTQNCLASAYLQANKLELAFQLYNSTLESQKSKLGLEHPDTLTTQSNLAGAYLAAGRFDLAIRLYESTLKSEKSKLGDDHPSTLTTQFSLASAYNAAGKIGLSLSLSEATLNSLKATLGDDHPKTLRSQNNLAGGYESAGKLDTAIQLYEATLNVRRSKLGDAHPDTLRSQNNLAFCYKKAGKLDLAIPLFEMTLKCQKEKFGDEHPSTLTTQSNLASAYQSANRLDLATQLFESTLKSFKRVRGDSHPNTLTLQNNLATAYAAAGRNDLAIPLEEATLAARKDKLGMDHPDTLSSQNNLAESYFLAGMQGLGISTLESAIDIALRRHDGIPAKLRGMPLQLAGMYDRMKQYDKSEPIYQSNLIEITQRFGESDQRTADAIDLISENLLRQKKFVEAVALLRKCLEIREADQTNWNASNARCRLGVSLMGLDKMDEAEALLTKGFSELETHSERIPAKRRGPVLQAAAQSLVELNRKRNNNDELIKWEEKLKRLRAEPTSLENVQVK